MRITKTQQSIFLMLLRFFLYTVSFSILKTIDEDINLITVIFIKYCFSFLLLLPFVLKNNYKVYKTKYTKTFAFMIALMCITIPFTYYGYKNLPISLATAISFSAPLFTAILANRILKEVTNLYFWVFLLLGYIGIIVMIWPIAFDETKGVVSLIIANILASIIIIFKKKLTRTENTHKLMLFPYIGIITVMGIAFTFFGTIPSPKGFLCLFTMGSLTIIMQYAGNKALSLSNASFLAPFEYSRMLFSIPIGMILFKEHISIKMILGSFIVIVSNYFISRINLKSNN